MEKAYLDLAQRELDTDGDHLTRPTREELAWLAAQLAAWPTRVDARYTTNDRFLRMSAARFIINAMNS